MAKRRMYQKTKDELRRERSNLYGELHQMRAELGQVQTQLSTQTMLTKTLEGQIETLEDFIRRSMKPVVDHVVKEMLVVQQAIHILAEDEPTIETTELLTAEVSQEKPH